MSKSREKIPEGLPAEGARAEEVKTADPRTHYVELDSLRGLAMLVVAMTHITMFWIAYVGVSLTVPLLGVDAVDLLLFGSFGLPLFYLLSGYLLTWMEEKRARSGTFSVRAYALRRALRLVPAYYVAILVVIFTWPVISPNSFDFSLKDVLMHASFLHTLSRDTSQTLDPVWWSLTPEVVFYCLLPFIVLKLPRLSQRLALFGVLLLVSLAHRVSIMLAIDDNWPYNLPTTHLWLFLAGVLLRMLVEHLEGRPASRLRLRLASALFLTSAVITVTLPYLVIKSPFILQSQGQTSWSLLLMPEDLIVTAFFASVMLGSPLLRAVLRWRFLAFVGMISYSMFLLHHTVLLAAARFLPEIRDWVAGRGLFAVWAAFSGYALAILMVAGAIAYLSYRYIESPFLRYKPK